MNRKILTDGYQARMTPADGRWEKRGPTTVGASIMRQGTDPMPPKAPNPPTAASFITKPAKEKI